MPFASGSVSPPLRWLLASPCQSREGLYIYDFPRRFGAGWGSGSCLCLPRSNHACGWRGQTEKELALDRARADGGGWLIPRRWVGTCDLVAATEIPRAAGRQGQGTSMSTRGWCAAAPTGGFCLTPWPWAPVRAKPPMGAAQRCRIPTPLLCSDAGVVQWSWCFKSII